LIKHIFQRGWAVDETLTLMLRFINGAATIWLSYQIYSIYRTKKRSFYGLWSLGFFFYGASILVRLIPIEMLQNYKLGIVSYLLLYTGFSCILVALGSLVNKANVLAVFSSALLLINIIVSITSGDWIQVSTMFGLFLFLLISLSLLIIQIRWKIKLELLTLGWLNVLITNIAMTTGALDPGYTEIFSTFNKLLLYWGITQSRFSYIVEDLQQFFIRGVPTEPVELDKGSVSLVNLNNGSRAREIQWIKDRVAKNSRKGINTILLVCYDLISPHELMTDGVQEHLYVVRLVSGNIGTAKIFDKHIMTINDDINQLDILLTDIVNYSNERRFPCEIILYNLSHLIHMHSWKRVYTFLISKITMIKSSSVQLLGFYYPETHNDAEILKFETLADRIITN